jgi:hypothetical protein
MADDVRRDRASARAVDHGGHFAAWEEPALFASEPRVAFKPLRSRVIRLQSQNIRRTGCGSARDPRSATPREEHQGSD